MALASPELNISLEPHLHEALTPLVQILPTELSIQLKPYLEQESSSQPTQTIPYPLLQSLSQWSRTPSGLEAITMHDPLLPPHDYTMIALLAGTTTSPERNFPAYILSDPTADQKRDHRDKKAITAVFNAVLSVLGSGAATWWAAEKTGWRAEWKVLLSFLVATIIAVSETVLYIVWESRQSAKGGRRKTRRLGAGHKKVDGEPSADAQPTPDAASQIPESLRQRIVLAVDTSG